MITGFKERLRGSQPLFGSFIQLPSPEIVELYGIAKFDFVILDLEHGAFGFEALGGMIRAAECRGITPIVRLHELSRALVSKVLDLGAVGVMVPHIRNSVDVRDIVQAAKYGPLGSRGYCSGVRAANYFSPPSFTIEGNERTVVLPLIENLEACEDFDAILKEGGIDGVMIGPGDLSAALGMPGKWDELDVRHTLEQLVQRAVSNNVPVGMHIREPRDVRRWLDLGVTFFTYGMDAQVIVRHLSNIRGQIDNAIIDSHE